MLELSSLNIRFGGLSALSDINFSVPRNSIYSVIGPNGAGKTTLFNLITGVYLPSSGKIFFEGTEVGKRLSLRTFLGVILVGLFSSLGVLVFGNIETLWERVITANYVYQEIFPWGKAFHDLLLVLGELTSAWGLIIPLIGFLLGCFGAYAVWRRSRISPEVTAKKGICRTFQNIRLFPEMTVLENVLVGMDCHLSERFFDSVFRLPRHWREKKKSQEEALSLLALVGLEEQAEAHSTSLPYGSQRRLEIARALASKPKILLLDEPAAGMNPTEACELMNLIRKIRNIGVTILLIEHHMSVVMGVSDRIMVLDYGNKIAEGSPAEIRANPKVIAAYLGEEA